jgi:hypothetical protein
METVLGIIAQLKEENVPLLIKLRGLWLLEKVARNRSLFGKDTKYKHKDVFEPLSDFFVSDKSEFVHKY